MDHTQDAAPEPAITQRMQQDIDLLILHLLEYQRIYGRYGVRCLINTWDWAGVLTGFELSTILPNPTTLDSAQIARARVLAEADATSRANLLEAISRDQEQRARIERAVREGPVMNRIYGGVRDFVEFILRVNRTIYNVVDSEMVKLVVAALLGVCVFLTSLMLIVVF